MNVIKESEGRLTLTIAEAAKALGISKSLAYTLARENTLPGVLRLGSRYVVSIHQLQKYLHGNNEMKAGSDERQSL